MSGGDNASESQRTGGCWEEEEEEEGVQLEEMFERRAAALWQQSGEG